MGLDTRRVNVDATESVTKTTLVRDTRQETESTLANWKGRSRMAQIPMLPQFYLGEGVNSASGQIYGQALDFSVTQSLGGQTIELVLESVSSSRELTEKLNIGASASLNLGIFSASAEFKLANSASINSYYTYALVRVVVQNPPQILRDPMLRGHAKDLLIARGWDGFAEAYGWEYIQGVVTGGSYYALIEVQTTDAAQQQEVKAKLGAAFGPIKADASVETSLQDATKDKAVRVIVYQSAGIGDLIETDLEGMLTQARNFPQLVRDNPTPISVLTAEYHSTVPIPSGVPALNSLARLHQRDALQELGRAYLELRDYTRTVEFILGQQRLSDFDDFRDLSGAEIEEQRAVYRRSLDGATKELQSIVMRAQRCSDDYSQCELYVSDFQRLPLPRKGGELMNLRELEGKIAALEAQFATNGAMAEQLEKGERPFRSVSLTDSATVRGAGRLHVAGDELLYVLNRSGVIIGREWGGSGDLFVQGTSRLGSRSSAIRNLQVGSCAVGNSGTRVKPVTVPFNGAFEAPPFLVAVVRGDGRRELQDTFTVSVTAVTPGEFAANVCRIDAPSGWGQVVTLDWIAWESN